MAIAQMKQRGENIKVLSKNVIECLMNINLNFSVTLMKETRCKFVRNILVITVSTA